MFQYLWLVSSYFLFLPGSVMESCIFLRICPCLRGYSFYWWIFALVISYSLSYFCCVHCNFFITFFKKKLTHLFFPLMNMPKGLSVLFILWKYEYYYYNFLLYFHLQGITFSFPSLPVCMCSRYELHLFVDSIQMTDCFWIIQPLLSFIFIETIY